MRRFIRKRRIIWAGVAGAAVLAVFLTGFVRAATLHSEDVYHLKKGDVLEDDLIIAAPEVIIDGTIQGDLVAVAGRIEVNGTVTQDVMLAAKTIKITGEISDDARVVGVGVEISGVIGDDLLVAAGLPSGATIPPLPIAMGDPSVKDLLLLTETCRVGGNAALASGNATVDADIAGKLDAAVIEMTLSGAVGEDATILCVKLDVDEDAKIAGDLSVKYTQEANIPEGVAASVESEKTETQAGASLFQTQSLLLHVINAIVMAVFAGIGFILLCLIVTRFIPLAVVVPAKAMGPSPVWAGLYGLLALALFSFVPLAGCLLACLACFQGPQTALAVISFDLSALYLLWRFSPIVTGYWLGKKLTGGTSDKVELTPLVMGTLIIVVLGHIPILGYLVYFASLCLTAGGIVLACRPSSGSTSADSDPELMPTPAPPPGPA